MASKKQKKETKVSKNGEIKKDKPKKKKKKKKRPKTESDSKSKEQRRKILEFRRLQSRMQSPTYDDDNVSFQSPSQPQETTDINEVSTGDESKDDGTNEDELEEEQIAFIELSESQEDHINNLEIAFEEYDEDYFGFIEYDKFLSILKENKVNLSQKQETFLIMALTLIDEGVDYYGFLQIIRNKSNEKPDANLTKICQQIAIDSERKANVK